MDKEKYLEAADFMDEIEKRMKNMTLKEKCDFLAKEISLMTYKPSYDFNKELKG